MKRIVLLVVLSWAGLAQAQEAGIFARMGLDARALALGQALVADVEGAAAYYNPALAVFTTQPVLALSSALMALDRELQSVQLATRMPPRAGIAVVLRHAGVRNIDGRDASGYHTQTYRTDEYALLVAFGTQVSHRLTLGLGLQFFRADLFEGLRPVQSIGLDLGLLYQASESLHLGLAIDDVLARYTWNTADLYGPQQGSTTSDRFPIRVRVGASWQVLAGRLRLLGEYQVAFTSVEVRRRRVQLVGDAPREGLVSERRWARKGQLRLGATYRLSKAFAVLGGLDRIGRLPEAGGWQPAAGFMLATHLGNLPLTAGYTVQLERLGLPPLHMLTLALVFATSPP
ncbi:hypothetical protein [Rhodothermus profundi]|uniref:Long-chain fatty acid transport protein n=1 Tax=Rhodothermus profundi TaxID=633813 RepID=A0A1M6TQ31_9BACT|nr:hypothetical protein [Rhodothermus profundi]SHK58918.1 hypothetical protein SAMN04488087_1480 [Rhodothermus profundi]